MVSFILIYYINIYIRYLYISNNVDLVDVYDKQILEY